MPECTVIMPFRKELDSHFELIKTIGERLGYSVYRVDTHRFSGNIVEAINKALVKADLIVADLSGANPNVMYELAIAQSLGKKVLMVTDDRNTVPFDISSYRIDLIDPSSPEQIESLHASMRALAASTHVTGPLGGTAIYGQKLFGRRLAAAGIDLAPFVAALVGRAYWLGWDLDKDPDWLIVLLVYGFPVYLFVSTSILESTVGQRILGLKTIFTDGERLTVGRSALRALASFVLTLFTWGVSFLWALKPPGHRTLHDMATRTMVVRRSSPA
jgi:uncharacterized RDD family membrane protein YckC